ncbi:MAG: hypothetical protein ACXABK_03700 [Candidatus Heimdallarchaeaceae archaeon]
MHRKGHLIGATIFWSIAIALYYLLFRYTAIDFVFDHSLWIILSFMVLHFGAQLPDYDVIWKRALPHRNVLTHSFILPLLLCLPVFFVGNIASTEVQDALIPIYAMYLIGHASHLFLDLKPEKWEGTALIHIWWKNVEGKKTIPKKGSRLFIFLNGLIIIQAGIFLLYFYSFVFP